MHYIDLRVEGNRRFVVVHHKGMWDAAEVHILETMEEALDVIREKEDILVQERSMFAYPYVPQK